MSYIRKILSHEEKILAMAWPHWIYLLKGIFWFCFFALIGLALDYFLYFYTSFYSIPLIKSFGFSLLGFKITAVVGVFLFMGMTIFWPFFLIYAASEVGLTNQRIIHKSGIFFIRMDEIDLEDIRAEHIYHGWFGWLLGYGKVTLDCRFISDIKLPEISHPYHLVKVLNKARLRHPSIDYAENEFTEKMTKIEDQERQYYAKSHMMRLKRAVKARFQKAA